MVTPLSRSGPSTHEFFLTMSVAIKYGCWTITNWGNNFDGWKLVYQAESDTFEYFRRWRNTRLFDEQDKPWDYCRLYVTISTYEVPHCWVATSRYLKVSYLCDAHLAVSITMTWSSLHLAWKVSSSQYSRRTVNKRLVSDEALDQHHDERSLFAHV